MGNQWGFDFKFNLHEIALALDEMGAREAGEILLHELAHAENHACDIRDCRRGYHNKKFSTMALRLGLRIEPKAHPRLGFYRTDLADGARKFLQKIRFNE